ncbi:hypothetical protein HYH02_004412 [Chlamydomonas schloesseri]|uniref:Uncharacterized protein n=1 Tax=Chlamydomonas schloesseri TaxID=2026947 RepID=A0A836B988_9CHLO|nr:hypothetical protein HYH02_004412 [Chlamydomonas schloesseri]|eukprot:KAG2451145.1 hypothetical protein HYH02_004412 [Chlamydomonas schloesseri]
MLASEFIGKLVFIGTSDEESKGAGGCPADLQSRPQLIVVQSLSPGLSSYSVFVEARRGSGVKDEASLCEEDDSHQAALFAAAMRAILTRPRPPGPGRLAFSAVPQHGAAAMLAVLRAAGYDQLWDEPCHRYVLRAPLNAAEPQRGHALLRSLQAQGFDYQLDSLRSDPAPGATPDADPAAAASSGEASHSGRSSAAAAAAVSAAATAAVSAAATAAAAARAGPDALLVNSLWTYRSAHSLALVQLLVEHRTTVCVRLRGRGRGQERTRDTDAAAAAPAPAAAGVDAVAAAAPPPAPPGEQALASCSPANSPGSSSDAVAWILQYGDGSVGMAHTLSSHRRRGLMRLALTEMVRRLQQGDGAGAAGGGGCGSGSKGASGLQAAQQGQHQQQEEGLQGPLGPPEHLARPTGGVAAGAACGYPPTLISSARQTDEVFAFIVLENAASVALFEGLGFRRCERAYHWFGVEGGG